MPSSPTFSRPIHDAARHLARWLGLVLPLAVGLGLAWHSLSDLDIWLHDRLGRDILEGRGILHRNALSFTAPDQPWTDHEWLFQTLVAAVGGHAEPQARARVWGLLCAGLAAALLTLLWWMGTVPGMGERLPAPRRSAALALPALGMLALAWPRLELRPELLSLLAFALTLRWIGEALLQTEQPGDATGPGWRRLISPRAPAGRSFWLTVLWAQWHGFWLLAPGLWLLAALLDPLDRRLARRPGKPGAFLSPLRWCGPCLATFLAGAITPNGLAGLAYPFQALGQLGGGVDLRSTIAEMAPLFSIQNRLGLTILATKGALVWSALWMVATAGRVPLLNLAALAAGFGAALFSQRNLGFCGVAFFLAHAAYDGRRPLAWRLPPALRTTTSRVARAVPVAALLLAAGLALWWLPSIASSRFYLREGTTRRAGLGLAPTQFPFRAAQRAAASRGDHAARILNNIDAASTLVNTHAGLVYIDGRTEAYPVEMWREYHVLRDGGEPARQIIARRQPDAVVITHGSPGLQRLLDTLLADDAWRLTFADEAGVLFLPAEPPTSADDATGALRSIPAARAAAARLLAELPPRGGGVAAADRCLVIASLLNRVGLSAAAESLAWRGLAACPDHPLLNHNCGNSLLARGEYAAAATRFRAALAASPALADSRINLGVSLYQGGEILAASRVFARATREAPRRAEAWANLAEARFTLGDRRGAREAMRRAAALRPADPQLRRRLAEMGG